MSFLIGIKLRIKNYNRLYFTLKCTSLSRISFNFSKYNLKGSLTFQKFINFPPFYYIHYQVIHYIIQIIEHVIVPIIFFHYVLWFLHATPYYFHCLLFIWYFQILDHLNTYYKHCSFQLFYNFHYLYAYNDYMISKFSLSFATLIIF